MLSKLYNQDPPPQLNHYTNAEALLGIMKGRALWATHIRYLNDSHEFLHTIEIAKDFISELQMTDNSPLLETLWSYLDESMPGNTFVISFSEETDLLSQWRGYCPSGGYSLGFNSNKLKQLAEQQRFVLVKCTYNRGEQEIFVRSLMDEAVTAFPSYHLSQSLGDDATEDYRIRVFVSRWFFPRMQRLASAMKDPAFIEEKEWRLVGALHTPLPPFNIRTRGALLVPYEVFELAPNCHQPLEGVIESILIGPNADQELAAFGVDRLQQLGLVRGMMVERSKVPYRINQ